jgi:hypothetical protein
MASTPKVSKFQKTGFYSSADIPALQEQLAKYNVPEADVRQQAEAQYAPTYNMQKTTFQNQLSELAATRDRDIQKLNTQYDRNLNSVMAQLNARNMGRSSLVSTRGVEVENARNGAVSDTSFSYLQKENDINAQIQQADATYAQNVENKVAEINKQNQAQYIELLTQIAQLQQSGYSAYANYLLNK